MPLYDYRCVGCGVEKHDVYRTVLSRTEVFCDVCGKRMDIQLSPLPVHQFPAGYWESLDTVVRSKSHLKQICEERGYISRYLEDTV